MCNIAGYVGSEAAAPILIEMMRREEGLMAGYYTGIATIHKGKLYYAKLTGDLERLIKLTDAAALPGNIGIIHSRSKSGGGDSWAHPFIAKSGGVDYSAYVANGAGGSFGNLWDYSMKKSERLMSLGYDFSSMEVMESDIYPKLSDGSSVHASDVMCQTIQNYIDLGKDTDEAMEAAFSELPAEIVGLLISLSDKRSISYSRICMPMWVGFSSHGAYLASTSMAFPEDAHTKTLLPALSYGKVFCDRFTVNPFKVRLARVGEIDPTVEREAYDKVLTLLSKGEETMYGVVDAVNTVFTDCDCKDSTALSYKIVEGLLKSGKIYSRTVEVPGAYEGIFAPELRFTAKERVNK